MHSIGLTGGIGTGKSSVAQLFADRGAAICDADEVAHALLEAGGAAEAAVIEAFGPEILSAQSTIDRALLGERVFADPAARAQLEAITHPLIAQRLAEAAREALAAEAAVFLVEAALLVETGLYRNFETLIVVRADPAVVRARVMARDGLSPQALEARIAAQASDADRLAVADHVIDNNDALEDTEHQVSQIWSTIVGG